MRLIFWIGLIVAVAIFLLVIELSRRDVLDRHSFFIGASLSIGLAVISLLPELLRSIASFVGINYTYVFTSTIGILALLVLNIYSLSKISRVRRELNDLSQEVAINAEKHAS